MNLGKHINKEQHKHSERRKDFQMFRDVMLDSMLRYRKNTLFLECRYSEKEGSEAIFTLKDEDILYKGRTLYSLKKIYLSYDHIPKYEYDFAMDVFGSWEHWVILSTEAQVKEHIQAWQEELEIRLKSEAMRNLLKVSRSEGNSATQANKFIVDKGWDVKAGRPTKEEKQRQIRQDSKVRENIAEDMKRLNLSVVGSK